MSLIKPLISAFAWLKSKFIDHIKSTAVVAVTMTETIKALLANPAAGFLENVADGVTHTQLPTEIATAVNNEIPKILAIELGVEGLPENPTADQILTFEQAILKAFNVNSDNSKLYTTLGAQIYGRIQTTLTKTPGKFADWVNAVEGGYQDYLKDTAAPVAKAA